jgi:hypothetical protein
MAELYDIACTYWFGKLWSLALVNDNFKPFKAP